MWRESIITQVLRALRCVQRPLDPWRLHVRHTVRRSQGHPTQGRLRAYHRRCHLVHSFPHQFSLTSRGHQLHLYHRSRGPSGSSSPFRIQVTGSSPRTPCLAPSCLPLWAQSHGRARCRVGGSKMLAQGAGARLHARKVAPGRCIQSPASNTSPFKNIISLRALRSMRARVELRGRSRRSHLRAALLSSSSLRSIPFGRAFKVADPGRTLRTSVSSCGRQPKHHRNYKATAPQIMARTKDGAL